MRLCGVRREVRKARDLVYLQPSVAAESPSLRYPRLASWKRWGIVVPSVVFGGNDRGGSEVVMGLTGWLDVATIGQPPMAGGGGENRLAGSGLGLDLGSPRAGYHPAALVGHLSLFLVLTDAVSGCACAGDGRKFHDQ